MANPPHKSASVARGFFPVVAIDADAVTVQRFNQAVEKRFCIVLQKNNKRTYIFYIVSLMCFLQPFSSSNLPIGRNSCTLAFHGSALKQGGTGGTPANFHDLFTPLHDVKYHLLWTGQNKLPLDANNVYDGMDMIWTLTRGRLSFTSNGAIYKLTVTTSKFISFKKAIVVSQVHCQYQHWRKTFSINYSL